MEKLGSYPKVFQLGHRMIVNIFDGEYHLEEKVDGSQISFGNIGGRLLIRSKGQQIFPENPEKMFAPGVQSILEMARDLRPDTVYRGEYLRQPKHNTLAYRRIPAKHIIIFDIEDLSGNPLPYDAKYQQAKRLGLECVPRLLQARTSEEILALLDNESCLGGQKLEGVVIKNYGQITVHDGKYMVGKYVSEAFKERHGKEWKKSNPGTNDVVQNIIALMKTEARYNKAIQHLKERGELTESPKDIGALMREIHQDIDIEDRPFIEGELYKHFIKQIKRGVCGGFPEWYKQKLLERIDE